MTPPTVTAIANHVYDCTRSPSMIHPNTAAANGLSAKITSTIDTLVRDKATTIAMLQVANVTAMIQPGRPIVLIACQAWFRSRCTSSNVKLAVAASERQNTVVQACG